MLVHGGSLQYWALGHSKPQAHLAVCLQVYLFSGCPHQSHNTIMDDVDVDEAHVCSLVVVYAVCMAGNAVGDFVYYSSLSGRPACAHSEV